MRKKSKRILSAQYLLRINQIFKNNNWEIESTEDKAKSHFNRFCQRVLEIGENQKRDLFLALSERYLWLTQDKYLEYLISTLVKMFKDESDLNDKKIYVMPMVAPEDIGEVKSSTMLVYLFNDVKIRYHTILGKYKFHLICNSTDVQELMDKDSVLLLADDFIGTGKTTEKCLLNLKIKGELNYKIKIISLVAQQEGIDYISKYNIPVITYQVRNKGVSDYYSEPELTKNIRLMEQIESKMSVKNDCRFGYGKSEALVTMCRTPNNTFPIFWEENGNMKNAPFPRN